jgi:hypothetical protein
MKEELVQLITTYVAARCSSDPALIDFAGTRLNQFLAKVELTEAAPLEEVSFRD